MSNSLNFSAQLKKLSKYRALVTARRFLLFALLALTLYVGYLGVSLVPFYLSVMLALLPNLLKGVFRANKSTEVLLPIVERRLDYSKEKHLSTLFSFYLTIVLLMLWAFRFQTFEQIIPIIKYTPTILIISALGIYTIGQYYYFMKFHRSMMNNDIKNIK